MLHGGAYKLIDKTKIAVTRPVLEKAKWRCQGPGGCRAESGLRVIEHRGKLSVVCDVCRARLGSPSW